MKALLKNVVYNCIKAFGLAINSLLRDTLYTEVDETVSMYVLQKAIYKLSKAWNL